MINSTMGLTCCHDKLRHHTVIGAMKSSDNLKQKIITERLRFLMSRGFIFLACVRMCGVEKEKCN